MIRSLSLLVLLSSFLLSPLCLAIGVGQWTIHSKLGEKLNVSAQLLGTQQLANSDIHISLAPPEAYQRAGITMQASHHSLRFAILRNVDKQAELLITSTQLIKTPFVHFLIKIQTPNETLYKEVNALVNLPSQ